MNPGDLIDDQVRYGFPVRHPVQLRRASDVYVAVAWAHVYALAYARVAAVYVYRTCTVRVPYVYRTCTQDGRVCMRAMHDAPACVCGCTTDPAMTQEPIFVRVVGISFPGPPDPLESDLLVFIVQTTVDLDGARPSIYKRLT